MVTGLAAADCPSPNFKIRKEPFRLMLRQAQHRVRCFATYRSPVASPFGLSLSKPFALGTEASTGSAWPFDKLRANGGGEQTVVNSRTGPQADAP
jgi:hypothetical protein